MHLQQNLQSQFMGSFHQHLAFGSFDNSCDEKYYGCSCQTSLKQLILINDKILVKDWYCNAGVSCHFDKLITTSKEIVICQNTEACRSSFLVADRNDISLSRFIDPSFGWRTTFKLTDDA